jgi:tetratricopeptide (TPR) repeat protein
MRSFAWLELQRGVLALSRGQTVRARAHYERAQAAFPGSWHTDEHLAEVLAAEGRDDEAVTLLRSVVERAPKPELKQALGELLSHVGRADEARPWFEAAEAAYLASVTDGCVHYYHHLADYYADSGNRPEEAVHWARKDLALRANFSTQSALAWALFRAGDFSAGLAQIQPALDSGAQTAGIYLTASSLHQAAGDLTQGEFYAREAERVSPGGHRFHLHH